MRTESLKGGRLTRAGEPSGLEATNIMFSRLVTDYDIRNQCFFAIPEAITTDRDLSKWKCNDRLQRTVK